MRQVPRLYGKVQRKNPPRFLTQAEADRLIAACQDCTEAGLRDEIVIRLGLAGLRAAEIIHLRWATSVAKLSSSSARSARLAG